MLEEMRVIKERCSVTMFDMHVEISRDGRERGLWITIEDQSDARSTTYNKWIDNAIEVFVQMMGYKGEKEEQVKKFSAWLSLDGELRRLANGKVSHAVLLEWPAIEKFYKAMGKAIKDGKRAERIRLKEEEYRQWRTTLKTTAKSSRASSTGGSAKRTSRKTSRATRKSTTRSSATPQRA